MAKRTPPEKPPKRDPGTGSAVYRDRNGFATKVTTAPGKRITIYGPTVEDVERQRLVLTGQVAGNTYTPESRTLLGPFLDDYLRDLALRRKARTLVRYQELADLHIKPRLGNTPLKRLTPMLLSKLYRELITSGSPQTDKRKQRKPLSPATVQRVRSLLQGALRQAMRYGLVNRNAAQLSEPPGHEPPDQEAFTLEEVRTLLDAAQGTRLYALLVLAVMTGARQGELLGLLWEDVDLNAGLITFRRNLQRIGGTLQLITPKTKRQRGVALDADTVAVLRRHLTEQKADRLRAGAKWDKDAPALVFPNSVGRFWEAQGMMRDGWYPLLSRAKLPRRKFHALRHTHSTLSLIDAGQDPKTVADRLGHANANLTLNVYTHVVRDAQRQAVNALGTLIRGK